MEVKAEMREMEKKKRLKKRKRERNKEMNKQRLLGYTFSFLFYLYNFSGEFQQVVLLLLKLHNILLSIIITNFLTPIGDMWGIYFFSILIKLITDLNR